jgi:ribose transport system permease protein
MNTWERVMAFGKRVGQFLGGIYPPLLALILAVLLFFGGYFINPNFVNLDQAINIVRLAAFLGIIAAGQTLVIISGGEGIDLSVGALVTLGAILTFRLSDGSNAMIIPALLVTLGAGAAIGFVNGIGVALIRIPPLVMTLGMAGVVEGLILQITRGQLEGNTPELMSRLIAEPLFLGIPGVVIFWIIFGIGMWMLLERTSYGKRLFAVGVNRTTARLSGVNVPATVIATYTIGGMLAAFGGFMLLGFTQTVFLNLGGPKLFPSIAAVAVGGTLLSGGKGSYWGTMSGALVLTLIDSLLTTAGLQEAYQLIILGVLLVLLISVYGRGRSVRQ